MSYSLKEIVFGIPDAKKEEKRQLKEKKRKEKQMLREGGSYQTHTVSAPFGSSTTTTTTESFATAAPPLEPQLVKPVSPPMQTFVSDVPSGFTTEQIQGEPVSVTKTELSGHIESVEKALIVQETIKPIQDQEIQPVIYREREQTEIRQILQPFFQKNTNPVTFSEKTLPAEVLPEVFVSPSEEFKLQYAEGSRVSAHQTTETVETHRIVKPPIVQETIRRNIVEEIQPLIHKETIVHEIIRATKPVYVKIHEAPILTKETRETIVVGPGENLEERLEKLGLKETSLNRQGSSSWKDSFGFHEQPVMKSNVAPLSGQHLNMESPSIIDSGGFTQQPQSFEKKLPAENELNLGMKSEAPLSQ